MPNFTVPDASGLTPLELPVGLTTQQPRHSGSELTHPAPEAVARFQAAMAEPKAITINHSAIANNIGRAMCPDTPEATRLDTSLPNAAHPEVVPCRAGSGIDLGPDIRHQKSYTPALEPPADIPTQLPTGASQLPTADVTPAVNATPVSAKVDIGNTGRLDAPDAALPNTPHMARPEAAPYQADAGINPGQDIRHATGGMPTRLPTSDSPTSQPMVGGTTQQPATSVQTQLHTADVPAEQPTANVTPQLSAADVPAEQPTANVTTRLPAADVPAEQPTANVTTQLPAAGVPTEQPMESIPTQLSTGGSQLVTEATPASVAATPADNRQQVTRADSEQPVREPIRSIRQTTDDKQTIQATDNVTAPLQAAPIVVPVAPDAAPAAVTGTVSIEIDPAAATAKTRELVETAAQVADTILVTPSLVHGEGEITIQLKPTVLDGSEIRLEAKGTSITVAVTPATPSVAQVIAQSQAQFEQALVERLPSFQIAVTVAPLKTARRSVSAT